LCTAGSSGPGITDKDGIPEFVDVPGVQTGGDKMILMFTCTVCDTRSARKISKRAYNEGIVMVRCAGCNNRHLIADRMGVFEDSIPSSDGSAKVGEGWDIQKYLQKEMGVQSKHVTDENVFQLTMQDILGAKAAAVLKNNGAVGDGEANR
jgi:protein import protein ZIM17